MFHCLYNVQVLYVILCVWVCWRCVLNFFSQQVPVSFHDNHGKAIVLSNNNKTAKGTGGAGWNGIVVLRDPMAVNMLYEVIQSLLVMLRDPLEVNMCRFPNGRWRNPSHPFPH